MPSRSYMIYPGGAGVPTPTPVVPPVYNWANDIVRAQRQAKTVVRGQAEGYKTASGILVNSSTSPPPPSYLGAPRTARYLIGGNQAFVGSSVGIAAEALINLSIFQNYNGLEQSMVSTYGNNFPQAIAAIQSAAVTAGNTYCKQLPYSLMEACSPTSPAGANSTFTVQYNTISAKNWFLRNPTWPGGSTVSQGTANTLEVNSGNQSAVVSTSFGTMNYPQWWATYIRNLYHLGQGGAMGEPTYPVACSGWGGDYNDNFFNATRQTGDWGNNGVTLAAGNATGNAYLQKGQAQMIAQRRALNTDLQVCNCDWYTSTSAVYDSTMLNILDGQLCEFALGNQVYSGENFLSFATLVSQLQLSASKLLNSTNITLIGQSSPDQTSRYWPSSQSSWIAEDWQGMRFGAALAAILDMYHSPTISSSSGNPHAAELDSVLRADEYGGFASGPGLNWLKTPIDSVATAIVPWQGSYGGGNAVLRRRWVEGTVYLFPYGNSGPVTVSASGHRLATQGYGDPAVNTGAAFTSLTGQIRDAIFTLP